MPTDLLAGIGVEGDDLGVAGCREDAILGKGDPAAESRPGILGLDADVPEPASALAVIGADRRIGIHRKDAIAEDYGRREDAAIARRAVADAGPPAGLNVLAERDVLHDVIGIAAGLGPVVVDDRARQPDLERGDLRIGLELLVEAEHGEPLAGQWRFRRRAGDEGERRKEDEQRAQTSLHSDLDGANLSGTGLSGVGFNGAGLHRVGLSSRERRSFPRLAPAALAAS